jgi:hypothetical protein
MGRRAESFEVSSPQGEGHEGQRYLRKATLGAVADIFWQ